MYDINKNTAPENILKLFSRIFTVHTGTYNTRASTSEHFHTQESRLNAKRNAFSRVGIKVWGGIPQILKKKKKDQKKLLKDHEKQGYILVDTPIVKMKK